MSVAPPVQDVVLYCPPHADLFEEMRCNLTISSGSYMTLTLDYGDGNGESFYVAGDFLLLQLLSFEIAFV